MGGTNPARAIQFGEPRGYPAGVTLASPPPMHLIIPLAAAGYSLVYLLAGGGLGGAVVIFIVAKLLGK